MKKFSFLFRQESGSSRWISGLFGGFGKSVRLSRAPLAGGAAKKVRTNSRMEHNLEKVKSASLAAASSAANLYGGLGVNPN